ncbi:protocadherin-20-like [Littorina saxatilis]|uniref:protocadherin-20-like n=1 Tax=Littorina saxatilis TaxID=31220 RepID=UPI0038B6382F
MAIPFNPFSHYIFNLQNPFDDLEFEMIGDGSTTAFFQANNANGAISVRPDSDLTSDTESEYIARLVVRDGGTPRLSDTATVVIQVPRNNFSPGFLHGDLTVRIPFNEDIGTVVADVNATDNDGQVSWNSLARVASNKKGKLASELCHLKHIPSLNDLFGE